MISNRNRTVSLFHELFTLLSLHRTYRSVSAGMISNLPCFYIFCTHLQEDTMFYLTSSHFSALLFRNLFIYQFFFLVYIEGELSDGFPRKQFSRCDTRNVRNLDKKYDITIPNNSLKTVSFDEFRKKKFYYFSSGLFYSISNFAQLFNAKFRHKLDRFGFNQ